MRYALSGTTGRPLALLVNGVQKATFTIPATTSWTTWATETKTIALTAGNHTISLKTTGQSGPNFDRMDITAIATAASSANSSVASSSRASASSAIAVTSSSKPSSSSGATSSSSAASQTPVATLYFVHNDHLGTPQVMTSKTQAVVYMADYQPFGKLQQGQANSIELYSRFPGQSLDVETGLYYNYFRDYDPSIGRYIESDPIGLTGGINTYAYVDGNPLKGIDPLGLSKKDKWYGFNDKGFRDWVHQQKQKEGRRGDDNYSKEELEELFEEWNDENCPGGKGSKSGKGKRLRGDPRNPFTPSPDRLPPGHPLEEYM